MDQPVVLKRLAQITSEAEALGPYLEGDLLQNKKATYTKKDGTVSTYATAPVLQYRAGEGKRRSKRIPADKVGAVKRLLEAGRRRRALLVEHRELAAMLALDFKKKPDSDISVPEHGQRGGGAGTARGGTRAGRARGSA